MADEKYQKELFEFEVPRKIFPKLGSMMPKSDFVLTLTLEKIVFLTIGIIMVMIVLYALGIEKGKSIIRINGAAVTRPARVQEMSERAGRPAPPKAAVTVPKASAPAAQSTMINSPVQPVKRSGMAPSALTETAAKPSKPYTIVAAAFTRMEWARVESEHLKKKGFDAFVLESKPYFMVCVGGYPTKDKAKLTLNKIRATYKDAYVKTRI